MTPRERAAAIAGFLDAAAPGWAARFDPSGDAGELLAAALEAHARRVGLDVATYARAHGWITGDPAGPFVVAWRAELARRTAAPRLGCCPAPLERVPGAGELVRCPSCGRLGQLQPAGMP